MQKILLLEDDLNLNRGIALLLSREGYEVRQVYTIKEAKEAFQKGDYALVISDITLPDGTGLDFGRMVRAGGDTYLIYLTALDQEIDIVNGYDTGADDYITKPFSLMALVSKVNALMRRLSKVQAQIMSSGEITVHMKTMQVYKGDEPVTLKTIYIIGFRGLSESGDTGRTGEISVFTSGEWTERKYDCRLYRDDTEYCQTVRDFRG